jgi:hypothetical protein
MRFMGHNSSFCHKANRVRESFVIFTKFTQVIELQISYCLHICECVSEEFCKSTSRRMKGTEGGANNLGLARNRKSNERATRRNE